MTITEQKAILRSYTGQAQAPADFAQRWQETAAALHPAVSCAPVAFGNPCGVYERLTVTFDGRSVTARVIRPAADGVHPLLLMYHDLNRGVRGWHHMTRFLALGFGVVAPEAEPFREDWKVQPAQAAFRQRYLDALAVAKAALALPWVDTGRVYTFGEGFGGGLALVLAVLVGLILAGLVAALFAALIGLPVLRLKSDYLAIATLGFAEILRAIFQWQTLGPITNGANMIKGFPTFSDFNIKNGAGQVILRLSTFVPFLVAIICIALIVLLINSSYGRAFKAIRDDEVAAEAMGISLFKHKMLSFVISSFFSGVGGALFAMYVANAQAKVFTSTMTYEILLIVVIGGIGSVSGSVIGTFLYVACSEWWLRFLDRETYIGSFKVPLLRSGFRMVVFSVVIMIIVLFFSKGIMGEKELSWKGIGGLFQKRKKAAPAAEKED